MSIANCRKDKCHLWPWKIIIEHCDPGNTLRHLIEGCYMLVNISRLTVGFLMMMMMTMMMIWLLVGNDFRYCSINQLIPGGSFLFFEMWIQTSHIWEHTAHKVLIYTCDMYWYVWIFVYIRTARDVRRRLTASNQVHGINVKCNCQHPMFLSLTGCATSIYIYTQTLGWCREGSKLVPRAEPVVICIHISLHRDRESWTSEKCSDQRRQRFI